MNQKRAQIIGGTAIFVALYFILFSGAPRFGAKDAEHILTAISEHFSTQAAQRRQNAKLRHGGIAIHGIAYEKWARISNLSLDWMIPQWYDTQSFGLSTTSADLIPHPINNNQVSFRLADIINIISGSELMARVQPATPFIYSIAFSKKIPNAHQLTLPTQMHITLPESKRDMELSIAPKNFVKIQFLDNANVRMHFAGNALSLRDADRLWSIKQTDFNYDAKQESPRAANSKSTLILDQIQFTHQRTTSNPYSLTAAWTVDEQRNHHGEIDAITLRSDQCILSDGKLRIAANGIVHFDIDDAAYGNIEIDINDVHLFIQSSLIDEGKSALALSFLNEIIGKDAAGLKQSSISISRQKNGKWMVGKMPLGALLDKGFMSVFIFNQ